MWLVVLLGTPILAAIAGAWMAAGKPKDTHDSHH
jgi:hypothetical protein